MDIKNNTKRPIPKVGFREIKDAILGKSYELSLVFVGDALSRRLNRAFRGKDKPTNILSFPLSKESGEIFINLSRTEPFGAQNLYIHGLLHLKGMEHGDTMERAENKFQRKFSNGKAPHSRDRHRQLRNKGSYRRGA